ncbi:glycosyltransferase family 2 protein [Cyanobium sp. CH-040]|uniref:glycosyltransferase family 2 protein n=1 Tax=Cyanobium sp. CH-040 TaxID=2823708 RepID=UPI0020CE958E|nr:glycosyltransferase family 2 protein [Cyanobium sp. CH-040]MCP9928009.1 glycosyltransferase family 2 protein [Cyanobium sp. CH-040]
MSTTVISPHLQASLTVVAIFKNEGDIIAEWTRHYFNQGATQILLIDNNSTDDWRGALADLGQDGRLTCLHDSRVNAQREIYHSILHSGLIKGEWLITCDLDEFIYARTPYKSISQYLAGLAADVSGVALPWKLFGSSGHGQHPAGRTVDNFLMRAKASGRILGKTISRTREVLKIDVHRHYYHGGRLIRSCGTSVDLNPFLDHDEERLTQEALHLNHYCVRSREFFEKVKMTRGNVFSANHVYLENYFLARDRNEIRDAELSGLTAPSVADSAEPSWFDPKRHPLPPGPRPPVFRLLEPASDLHLPADHRPLQVSWRIAGAGQHGRAAARWIDGGQVPADPDQVIDALAGLASVALAPLERGVPVWIDASEGRGTSLRRAQEWCDLLQLSRRVRWHRPGGGKGNLPPDDPRGERWQPDLSGEKAVQLWRCAAAALARHRRLQARLERLGSREVMAIALPSGHAGAFEKGLKPLLKKVAREHQIPILRLRTLPLEEQVLAFSRYRWIVGPYQPAMELVHTLGEGPHPAATLILLSRGVRRSRQLLQRLGRVHRKPHRLLVLPHAAGAGSTGVEEDRRALVDLIHWLRNASDAHPGAGDRR